MDDFLRGLLQKEIKVGKASISFLDLVFLLGITVAGCVMRIVLRTYVSDDWTIFWDPWIRAFQEHGWADAISGRELWYDYAPPFMYVLYGISRIPLNPMTAYKLVCGCMDFVAAFMMGKIVWELTKSKTKAFGAYGIVVIAPTVIANSAMWAQCDIIYMTFILISIYYLLKEKPNKAMIFYGIAFAFKLQSLFIFPFLLILWVNKKLKIQHFLWIFAMYFVGIFPAWLAGRPFSELLAIYVEQGMQDMWSLSIKWPNIYQIIGNEFLIKEYSAAGTWLILGILMCVLAYMVQRRYRITQTFMIQLALFFAVLTPYFLPHMHERYGFLADFLAIIYAMIQVRRFYIPLLHILMSFCMYNIYFTWQNPELMQIFAFVELGILFILGLDVYRYLNDPENLISDGESEKKKGAVHG